MIHTMGKVDLDLSKLEYVSGVCHQVGVKLDFYLFYYQVNGIEHTFVTSNYDKTSKYRKDLIKQWEINKCFENFKGD